MWQIIGQFDELLDGELFGAESQKIEMLMVECCIFFRCLWIEDLTKRHAQHFPALVEGGFHDALKKFFVATEVGDGVSRQSNDGGLHFRRRIEHGGFDREKVFDIVPRLHQHGEDAVGFRAGLGGHAEGDFVLNHAGAAGNQIAVVEHFEENLRGNVVGIVAREHEGATAEDFVEVHAEEIGLDN